MKKLLLTSMLSIFALSLFAQESTVPFSYSDSNVRGYGVSEAQRYDVAMLLDDASLAGNKIKSIKAYLADAEAYGISSVWLTKELTLSDTDNVADLYQQNAEVISSEYGENELKCVYGSLDEPFVYDGSPVWVGYSVEVTAKDTPELRAPIMISNSDFTEGFYMHGSNFPLIWRSYYTQTGAAAAIVVEFEGNFKENSLNLSSLSFPVQTLGDPFSLTVGVKNVGTNPVSSISYEYEILSSSYSGNINLENPLIPNLGMIYNLVIEGESIEEVGLHDLKFTITEVNGESNNSTDNYMDGQIGVIAETLTHRPMVEEFTGLWCGWCPRGFTGMETISEEFGDDVVVCCYHYAGDGPDAMQVTRYAPVSVSGFPLCDVDRAYTTDPYYGTSNTNFGIIKDVENAIQESTPCDIMITNVVYENGEVSFDTETYFVNNYTSANYKVGYVLTANGVTDPDWVQNNYFALLAYRNEYKGTPLESWTTMGTDVYGLVFNDVVIYADNMAGVNNSLPSEITFGEVYTSSFKTKAAGLKNINGEELPYSVNNVIINAFVLDASNNRVVNANKFALSGASGVKGVSADTQVVETVYYDLMGRKISDPANGIFVKVDKLSDGSLRSSKVAVR